MAEGNDSCDATLGNKVRDSCIFHDITFGDTDVVCTGHHNCYLPSDTYGALSSLNKPISQPTLDQGLGLCYWNSQHECI